jgi:hypothetical protein
VKAVEPGRRRNLFVLIVVACAVVLDACGTAPLALTATVPWRPIPPSPTTTTTTTTTTLAPAPRCNASQLRAGRAFGGAATGNLATVVVLKNTGTRCRLGGYPTLVGISATRGRVRLITRHGTFFGNLIPADLANGQSGKLILGTEDACNALNQENQAVIKKNAAENTYSKVVIIFPNGEGSLIASPYPFDVACGLDETELGVVPPLPASQVPTPGSPGSLSATVNLPRTAKSGRVLSYTVSLYNSTHTDVDLHHCPNYTEALYPPAPGRPTIRTYTLNCTRSRPISPGETRVFAMELPINKLTTSTTAKFGWQLDTGLGPYGGGALLIVPSTNASPSTAAIPRLAVRRSPR